MKPLVRGQETDLIEIPASWYLDDLPPMMFIKGAPNSHGFVNPRHLEEIWRDQFDYVYREEDYAVFAMTIHPDVSGRPQVILMLERMIEHINKPRRHPLGDDGRDRRRLREEVTEAGIDGAALLQAGLSSASRPEAQPASAASVAAGSRRAPSAICSNTRAFGPARSPAKSAPASARSRPPPRP